MIKKSAKAKRVLTILLAVAMVATISLPGFIFADTEFEEAAAESQNAVLEETLQEDASEIAVPEEEAGEDSSTDLGSEGTENPELVDNPNGGGIRKIRMM
jgi:hypothetical protein